jgi:hypothetical protein
MIVRWAVGFGRFWYRFIVGDDWMIAATIAVGLVAVFALTRAQVAAWWLMPVVVAGALIVSLWRARQQRA